MLARGAGSALQSRLGSVHVAVSQGASPPRSQLVLWLPAVCRKMDIPYCIVKSKSRLGALVHKKTATAVALVSVRQEDRHEFSQLVTAIRQQYNENAKQIERTWGGGIMGIKSQAKKAVLERAIAKEAAKKAMM